MKIKVQVVIESDGGDTKAVENIACLERGTLQPVELGLTLDEAKDLLESMQQTVVQQQVAEYLEQQAHYPGCGKKRRRKGNHNPIVYRTLFGELRLPSMRFFNYGCQPHAARTFSPLAQLLTERTAPELLYLETKFASLASYGMTVKLLQEVLPLGNTINAATVRNKVHAVGRRIDKELGEEQAFFIDGCEYDWEQLPRPDPPLTVGIDGGHVHSNSQKLRKEDWFEVIAGKRVTAEGASKCFAFVNNYDSKPKRRLFEVLKSQGMQPNQQVTFLSDGADNVRDLQLYMNPNAEHILDWFHITKVGARTIADLLLPHLKIPPSTYIYFGVQVKANLLDLTDARVRCRLGVRLDDLMIPTEQWDAEMDNGIWSVTHKVGKTALNAGCFDGILYPPYPATSLIKLRGKHNIELFMDPHAPKMAKPLHASATLEVIDNGDILKKLGLIFRPITRRVRPLGYPSVL